ncbi:MAG TPA: bifunctional diaminohydroxyphosphoribosylaminopyrimidine deaminase/5-amino-6-(5-phosphoribosylamino)uracil reductase RibD [Pyrinomonadaceae bacterium]
MKNEFSEFDTKMMRLALELASIGVGQVSPSPLVGCVIVAANGEIAGEGTYIYENVTHAEVLALEEAGRLAVGGTAYVSLEPHSHRGRTKPCTEALINAGIKRVVVPIEDPNPLVSGKGFAQLRASGIEVATGVLAEEAARLNEKFAHWHRTKRPFVHLKMAMSLDGRISLHSSVSTTLSGKESFQKVHELRHEHDAILVGANTAVVDNPSLTDRSGKKRRKKLVRVILDNSLRLSADSGIARSAKDIPTIIFTKSSDAAKTEALRAKAVEIIQLEEGGRNLIAILDELGRREIQSVLVEGGTEIAGAFFNAKLIDKITFFVAPIVIGGRDAPVAIGGLGARDLDSAMRLNNVEIKRYGEDFEITGYPKKG